METSSMQSAELIEMIQGALPGSEVYLRDLTGEGNHFDAVVVSDLFLGKSRIEQQKMVMHPLQTLFNGPLHALALKTYTKEAWQKV